MGSLCGRESLCLWAVVLVLSLPLVASSVGCVIDPLFYCGLCDCSMPGTGGSRKWTQDCVCVRRSVPFVYWVLYVSICPGPPLSSRLTGLHYGLFFV